MVRVLLILAWKISIYSAANESFPTKYYSGRKIATYANNL